MKPTISLESEAAALQKTLLSSYSPAPVREARRRQDEVLLQRLRNGLYTMADIGCGNGYHAVLLAASTRAYHGFEVSPAMAAAARELWRQEGIANASIFVGDAAVATLQDALYDIVLCLYFTPETSATAPRTWGCTVTPISTTTRASSRCSPGSTGP